MSLFGEVQDDFNMTEEKDRCEQEETERRFPGINA